MINCKLLLKAIRESFTKGLSVVGAVYSSSKILKELLPDIGALLECNLSFIVCLFGIAFLSNMAFAVHKLYYREITIPQTNKSIGIRFGNILSKTDGSILVGINNTLEYRMDKIGKNSIQYQLAKKYGMPWMRQLFENEKSKIVNPVTKNRVYPYGYTFDGLSPDKKSHFVFLVMSGLKSAKVPETKPYYLDTAIDHLFRANNFRCINNRLYMPALGTGSVALPLSKQNSARNISHIFARNTLDESTSVHDLKIIFRWHSFDKVDLAGLYEDFIAYSRVCHTCHLSLDLQQNMK